MTAALRFTRRVDALFSALSTDYLLREQFVTDPAQILTEYAEGKGLPAETATLANQLLYAVLSNPGMVKWVREYARAQRGAPPSGEGFARDFSRTVAQHGDEQLILVLLRSARESRDLFAPQSNLLRAIIGALGGGLGPAQSGTEMSPGTGGTEMSPGTGGTEMSPGAARRIERGVFAGTEMSPGTGGTEMSPGTGGTEMSPGAARRVRGGVMAGTEMSPGGGTEMSPGTGGTEMSPGAVRRTGRGVFAGTEMSPGGTEMSPGTGGTEMSPGRAGPATRILNVERTFEALVQYANQVRMAGGLNAEGFEALS